MAGFNMATLVLAMYLNGENILCFAGTAQVLLNMIFSIGFCMGEILLYGVIATFQ